jgi:hypothetical protein
MKWIRIVFSILSLLVGFQIWAQSPFLSPTQSPLLLNPSLAGSKNKVRVATAYNQLKTEDKELANTYFSYDQTLKNTGIGLGGYVLLNQSDKDLVPQLWSENINTLKHQKYLFNESKKTVGLAVSAKYNLHSKKEPGKVWCSFSPSLSIDYAHSTTGMYQDFEQKNFTKVSYDSENPEGVHTLDSTYVEIVQQELSNNIFQVGTGLGMTLDKLMLQFKLTYLNDFGTNHISLTRYETNKTATQEAIAKERLQALDPSIFVAYSYSRTEDSKWSLTPMFGVGARYYMNLKGAETVEPNEVYSYNLLSKKLLSINYLHLSGTFRWQKFLFGTAYTNANYQKYYANHIGLQTSKSKLIYNFNYGKNKLNEVSMVFAF